MPIAGLLLGALPAIIIAAVDESRLVAVAITAIQQIESSLVTPLATTKSARTRS